MKNRSHKLALFLVLIILPYAGSFAQSDTLSIVHDTISVTYDTISIVRDKLPRLDTVPSFDSTALEIRKADTVLTHVDSTKVWFFRGTLDSLKTGNLHLIDTSTLYFHQSDRLFKYNGMYSTLSNIGLAHTNLVFTPVLSTGYYFKNREFSRYIYENDQVKYYKQFMPYTEGFYTLGPKREQDFRVIFTRRLFRGFSIGLDFALEFAPGYYKNSKTDDKRVFFTTQYYTKNKRYGVIANYLHNKLVMQENGGIINDTIFEDNLETDRMIIPVNLEKARNSVTQSGFFVEQYFNLLKPAGVNHQRKVDAGSISYAFQYQRNQMIYDDPVPFSDFYKYNDVPVDSAATFDSTYQLRIRNRFRWSSIGYHDDPASQIFYIYLGASYDYYEQTLPYDSVKSIFRQTKPFGGIALNIAKIFRLTAYAEYVMGDYNNGDLKISGRLNQVLGNRKKNIGRLNLGVDFVSRTPSWFYNEYNSNLYRWKNDFKKENYLIFFGEYVFRDIRAGARFYTFGNYVYMNDSIRPQQHENAATLLQIYLSGTIMVKKFGFNGRLVYQSPGQPEIVRVPPFSGVMDIFFKSPLFKKAATLQTGFQLYYFSKYKAYAYMPELRTFYIQNEKEIGNYIYADVYLTLKVKTARISFKLANFGSYFGIHKYYLAPNYPARDARFYLNVSWGFFN
ncbi:MAG: putative porin [Chlorobi bacterium]|nr:putative porin [Chlorobiota bacterium]